MRTTRNHSDKNARLTKSFVRVLGVSLIATGLLLSPLLGTTSFAAHKADKDGKANHDMSKMGKMKNMKPTAKPTDKITPMPISDKARAALSSVYDTYFAVQSALASDDLAGAVADYKHFDSALSLVDMKLFEGKTHMKWMMFAGRIAEQAKLGSDSKDINVARKSFEALSLSVIEMERTFGHTGDREFYLTFCPMAFGTGAYWMQADKTVNNSFFGKRMPKCGSVKETFTSTSTSKNGK